MARVTNTGGGPSDTAWQEDRWYGFTLKEIAGIEPKGTPGYKNQPLRNARAALIWVLDGDTSDWVYDWVSLTVRSQNDGTPSTLKLLICALSQREHRQEQTPWVDDETLEYGFDADARVVAGQILPGVRVAAKGRITQDTSGYDRLRIEKYGPTTMVQAAPAANLAANSSSLAAQLSPDGRYQWNGTAWVPVAPPMPAPPPAAPPFVQTELI